MIFNSLKKTFMIGSITLLSINAVHADASEQAELNQIVKEDIISSQILLEICPTVVSNKALLQENIANFTRDALKRLNPSVASLSELQQDAEYKSLYQSAKKESAAFSADDIKSECENVIRPKEDSFF